MSGKKGFLWILVLISMILLTACENRTSAEHSYIDTDEETVLEAQAKENQWEKGYDLPIEEMERKEAESDCLEIMEEIAEIYNSADKGESSNVIISEDAMIQMKEVIGDSGVPVIGSESYSCMENYRVIEEFLLNCQKGQAGETSLYEVHWNGGIGRLKYIYNGSEMYVLSANASWRNNGIPTITYISYTRIKEWRYSEKGWFGYELCVPEPPEVTEIVNGSCMVRVKPLDEECLVLSEKYVLPLGYQGNNLLCSNWNTEDLKHLDYNGMYEYLYRMKYGEPFEAENYLDGIPAEEFECVIMEYLPVTTAQIRDWAAFDEDKQTYSWAILGCGNYAPTYFGTSLPEVIGYRENEDSTITLTVEAVCSMILCDDAVITHELTIRLEEDGSFQYLGNEILNDGINDIPDYQYRISKR